VLSVGHSSTSISAGIGVIAAAKEDKQRRAVCVIGDGRSPPDGV
jgi:1-deoxy-D-xylulose-5-phosphate synthase